MKTKEITKKINVNRQLRTMESLMICNGKVGDHFYSDKLDKHFTALSTYYKRKIKTERMIVTTTSGKELLSKYITKVILL
jgi:DTW domain-containing protein YfiP